jgi:hypothetical protein
MPTTKTLSVDIQTFPVGTSVSAYKQTNWPSGNRNTVTVGAPKGSADATASVQSDGTLAFTGLTDSTQYTAVAQVSSVYRYVDFDTYATTHQMTQGDTAGGDLIDTFPSPHVADFIKRINPKSAPYNAKFDVKRRVTTANMTSGSAAYISGSGNEAFTSADVGKQIMVSGAGTAGGWLVTTIQSVTDASHITLAANAATTVVNTEVRWGTDDTAALTSAINDALTAATSGPFFGGWVEVVLPPGGTFTGTLPTINKSWIRFVGEGGRLLKKANGAMFTVNAQAVEFHRVYIDGQGDVGFTGNGITVQNGQDFTYRDGQILNIDPTGSYCVQYTTVTSTRKKLIGNTFSITGIPVGKPAIGYPGTAAAQEVAGSSTIALNDFSGGDGVDFSGCSSVTCIGNVIGTCVFNAGSEVVRFIGNRLFGATTVLGNQHFFEGNAVGAALTLGSGCTNSRITGGVFAVDPVDSSGVGSNIIEEGCANTWQGVRSISADRTLSRKDWILLVDASGAARTITLPAASGYANKEFTVKKSDSSANTVTLARTGSDTIDGATSKVISAQYASLTVTSDGTNWYIT